MNVNYGMHLVLISFLVVVQNAFLPSCFVSAFSASDIGKANFLKYRDALPSDIDPVKANGYSSLFKLSENPKLELVRTLSSEEIDTDKVDSLVSLLQSRGKGFSAPMVDGEWIRVYARSGKKGPRLQKFVEGKKLREFSNFDTKKMEFVNISKTPNGNGELKATVKYTTTRDGFTKKADGKGIVLRRIMCDIIGASFEYWKLPKLPLPIRSKGGFLDFLYLDEDMRITRGNRGGLFIHYRPEFFEAVKNVVTR